MAPRKPVRSSGKTAGVEEAEREVATGKFDKPHEEKDPSEHEKLIEMLTFRRMRLEWRPEDVLKISEIKAKVNAIIKEAFPDVIDLIAELMELVDDGGIDPKTGEVIDQAAGRAYVAPWHKLSAQQREDYLFHFTSMRFVWKTRAVDIRGEALLAKTEWVEDYAVQHTQSIGGTMEDRAARANVRSAESRYFATYLTYLSHRADALVECVDMLIDVLKRSLTQF